MRSDNNKTTDARITFYICVFALDWISALITRRPVRKVICQFEPGFSLSFWEIKTHWTYMCLHVCYGIPIHLSAGTLWIYCMSGTDIGSPMRAYSNLSPNVVVTTGVSTVRCWKYVNAEDRKVPNADSVKQACTQINVGGFSTNRRGSPQNQLPKQSVNLYVQKKYFKWCGKTISFRLWVTLFLQLYICTMRFSPTRHGHYRLTPVFDKESLFHFCCVY